jgi:polyribonucleotide nucleotidyltransferase
MNAEISVTTTNAGISVGLVTHNDGKRNITTQMILTGIIGTEDHFRDMYFTCFGTKNGITGVQLELKIQGLPPCPRDIDVCWDSARSTLHPRTSNTNREI